MFTSNILFLSYSSLSLQSQCQYLEEGEHNNQGKVYISNARTVQCITHTMRWPQITVRCVLQEKELTALAPVFMFFRKFDKCSYNWVGYLHN